MAFWRKKEQEQISADTKVGVVSGEKSERNVQGLFGMLRVSRVTEKTSGGAGEGTYTFVVADKAGKGVVRRAIQDRYGVEVESVRIINVPGKMRRRGRQTGWKHGFKKAMVTVKEGQRIEIE